MKRLLKGFFNCNSEEQQSVEEEVRDFIDENEEKQESVLSIILLEASYDAGKDLMIRFLDNNWKTDHHHTTYQTGIQRREKIFSKGNRDEITLLYELIGWYTAKKEIFLQTFSRFTFPPSDLPRCSPVYENYSNHKYFYGIIYEYNSFYCDIENVNILLQTFKSVWNRRDGNVLPSPIALIGCQISNKPPNIEEERKIRKICEQEGLKHFVVNSEENLGVFEMFKSIFEMCHVGNLDFFDRFQTYEEFMKSYSFPISFKRPNKTKQEINDEKERCSFIIDSLVNEKKKNLLSCGCYVQIRIKEKSLLLMKIFCFHLYSCRRYYYY